MRSVTLAGSFLLVLVSLATASTYHVNPEGTGDYPTIQAAIDACSPGDTVLCASGTYSGLGNRYLNFHGIDLVLRSEEGPEATIIDGQYHGEEGFYFENGESRAAVVEGITVYRCGGISWEPWGGGIVCMNNSSPTLRNLILRENHAEDYWWGGSGGGLYCDSGSPLLEDVLFDRNVALGGGAGMYCTGDASPELRRVCFTGNLWDGMHIGSAAHPILIDVIFNGNDGPALGLNNPDSLVLEGLIFRQNHGSTGGGAVRVSGGQLTLRHCLFDGNKVEGSYGGFGGAINAVSAELVVESCTFAFNDAQDQGSAIYLESPVSTQLIQLVVADGFRAEAIYWDGIGVEPAITCCDVFGNEGGGYGGALADQTGLNGNISEAPLFCGVINEPPFLFSVAASSPCLPENNGCGLLMGAFGEGCPAPTVIEDSPAVAGVHLLQNHPNPFNPLTTIRFTLAEAGPLRLTVHDVSGHRLRVLADGPRSAGEHAIDWDGRDEHGRELASGIYLYRLEVNGEVEQRKMILLH